MDSLRGNFGASDDDGIGYDPDDEVGLEAPPPSIGADERRMQVRAYNHWASQLGDRSFPSIEDLEPENLIDFGPYSVLLDFSVGIENPAIQFLGEKLAGECGAEHQITQLSDIPSRSLLSRITDHYMQILANQAPIGFEAEFINQRDATILYRGILLPYSSDGETIDFIYGVINWKELADQETADELLLEIEQALGQDTTHDEAELREMSAGKGWADGPGAGMASLMQTVSTSAQEDNLQPKPEMRTGDNGTDSAVISRLSSLIQIGSSTDNASDHHGPAGIAQPEDGTASSLAGQTHIPETDAIGELSDSMNLHDHLAAARELAMAAREAEDRSRAALYAAISRANDVALAAEESPDEFAEILVQNGLEKQDRAPLTPVVKLVFGADYDKTRLAEYATVLSHAQRNNIGYGELGSFIATAKGGIKGIVEAERRLRKQKNGKPVASQAAIRPALAGQLRELDIQPISEITGDGPEFGLVMIRRLVSGEIMLIGDVSSDVKMVEKAGRKLLG